MTIETRCDSKRSYEFAKMNPRFATEATGFLSFRRTRSRIQTIELDEDSFFLAFLGWSSFVEFSLGAYADTHQDVRASVYTSGPAPSVNSSHGELHQRAGRHQACFIGVVGGQRNEILDVIANALIHQRNVPGEVVELLLEDASKKGQICCKQSPDLIAFDDDPSWHVEDGRVWAPHEEMVWYTDPRWSTR